MKRAYVIIAMVVASATISGLKPVSAQDFAGASVGATIVTPITITKTVDMNFGNVAVQSLSGGNVVLSASGTRTASSGVTLPALSGIVSAASFDIAGQANYTYAVTLPASSTTIFDAGQAHNMQVDTWSSMPSVTGTLSASGTQTLKVGAMLHVGAGQAPGTYTSAGDFTVTVNYN